MKNYNTLSNRTLRRLLPIAGASALAMAFTVSLPQPARAGQVTPPRVPDNIQVPEGNTAFLVGHAVGTQNYICLPSVGGFAYALFTPEATLSNDNEKQLITHYFSPNLNPINPVDESIGTIRATWQSSRDTSTVWAKVDRNLDGSNASATSATHPDFVKQGAVAWLRLEVVGVQEGPTGRDTLTKTTFVQRVNTDGGVAPSTGCASSEDIGHQAFMPYTADYFFYTDAE